MERLFAAICGKDVLFSSFDEHHLVDVMRVKVGDRIEVSDAGDLYLAEVRNLAPLKIEVVEEIMSPSELKAHLCLAFSLLKGGHDELVIQKGTELGVSEFYPFYSSRTIVRLDKEADRKKREDRFRLIAKGASEQSKRNLIPVVHPIISYSELLKEKADIRLLAYEGEAGNVASLPKQLREIKDNQRLLSIVGPEGGFSISEVEAATSAGFLSVGLGKRILRAETASIYLSAIFSYVTESER